LYRFIISLGVIWDIEDRYITRKPMQRTVAYTPWQVTGAKADALVIELQLDNWKPEHYNSLVLAVGIEMGKPLSDTVNEPVKWMGSAKILGVG
jgi:hypothetical protein